MGAEKAYHLLIILVEDILGSCASQGVPLLGDCLMKLAIDYVRVDDLVYRGPSLASLFCNSKSFLGH